MARNRALSQAVLFGSLFAVSALATTTPTHTTSSSNTTADGGAVRVRFDVDNLVSSIDGEGGNTGCFVMEVHPDWAPLGAGRMMELLDAGFWTNIKFFRVISGFVAQFGISGDPAVSEEWRTKTIKDDPVTQSNQRGFVSFATSGPDTRTTQLFINFANNGRLDKSGFSPFAKIVQGMEEVVDRIYKVSDQGGEKPSQARIKREGNAYLDEEFPLLTYISSARIMAADEALDACSPPPTTTSTITSTSTAVAPSTSTSAATTLSTPSPSASSGGAVVAMVLELPYSVEAFQAPAVQAAFRRAVASAAGTALAAVTITFVAAVTAHLADTVAVDVAVGVESEDAARSLLRSGSLSLAALNAALAAEAVQPISAVTTAPYVVTAGAPQSESPDPISSSEPEGVEDEGPGLALIMAVFVGAAFVAFSAACCVLWIHRRLGPAPGDAEAGNEMSLLLDLPPQAPPQPHLEPLRGRKPPSSDEEASEASDEEGANAPVEVAGVSLEGMHKLEVADEMVPAPKKGGGASSDDDDDASADSDDLVVHEVSPAANEVPHGPG